MRHNELSTQRPAVVSQDAGFVLLAALLIAVSIGAVTSQGAGKPRKHEWTVTVLEGPIEVVK